MNTKPRLFRTAEVGNRNYEAWIESDGKIVTMTIDSEPKYRRSLYGSAQDKYEKEAEEYFQEWLKQSGIILPGSEGNQPLNQDLQRSDLDLEVTNLRSEVASLRYELDQLRRYINELPTSSDILPKADLIQIVSTFHDFTIAKVTNFSEIAPFTRKEALRAFGMTEETASMSRIQQAVEYLSWCTGSKAVLRDLAYEVAVGLRESSPRVKKEDDTWVEVLENEEV